MEPDKDTQQVQTEADHVRSLLGSDGWKVIYGKLSDRILDLQNINNLDIDKLDTLAQQLAARKMAVDLVMVWLKSDVFGFVEQQEQNAQQLVEKPDSYIQTQ